MGLIQANRERGPRVVHEIRIGSVTAVIRSITDNTGQPELTVVLRRVDHALNLTGSDTVLKHGELPLAARALDQAHAFICKTKR